MRQNRKRIGESESGLTLDSAEKLSFTPSDTAQGERGLIDNVTNFRFMLSLSKHSKGFFSGITLFKIYPPGHTGRTT